MTVSGRSDPPPRVPNDAIVDQAINLYAAHRALRQLADEVDSVLLPHRPQSLDLAVMSARRVLAAFDRVQVAGG